MANDLRKYGFTSNKSYDAYIPIDQINNKFINHYIRGFFDGDGSIYLDTKNKNLLRVSLTTASSQMCKDIFSIVKKHIDIEMHIFKRNNIISLSLFDQKQVFKFLN